MTDDEQGTFQELITALGECFQRTVSDTTRELYWQALRDLSVISVERACIEAVRQCKHFPRPAEVREIAFQRARAEMAPPGPRRIGHLPHTNRGLEMAQALVAMFSTNDRQERIRLLKDMAVKYPGIGWEEAIAEAEREVAA